MLWRGLLLGYLQKPTIGCGTAPTPSQATEFGGRRSIVVSDRAAVFSTGSGATRLARGLHKPEVAGSIPASPISLLVAPPRETVPRSTSGDGSFESDVCKSN